jgi:hypothetical protein
VKRWLALLAMTACLRAAAAPVCPMGEFYPASYVRTSIDSAVAEPKPELVHDHEQRWFDVVEEAVRVDSDLFGVYEVVVVHKDDGTFRVGVLRLKPGTGDDSPRSGVVDSRDLPAPFAERVHRGVIPILARTHYPAPMVQSRPRFECMGGFSRIYATVADIDSWFRELTGEGKPAGVKKESDVGSVETLAQALRDYALRRIDADGLEEPLKLVEARAQPDNEHPR